MCYFFWSNTPTADNLSLPLSLLNAKIYIFLIVLECALYGELWLFAWHNMKIVKVSVLASNAIYFDYVLFIHPKVYDTFIMWELELEPILYSLIFIRFVFLRDEREHTPLSYFLLFSVLDIEYLHWTDLPCKHVCWARVPSSQIAGRLCHSAKVCPCWMEHCAMLTILLWCKVNRIYLHTSNRI